MKKYLVLLVIPIFAYAGSPTIAQIEKAMQQGNIAQVEEMSQEAVREHPNSAKAHYFLGQAYFNENKMQLANAEFVTAKKLDPSLSFTKKPEVFSTMLSRSMPLVKLATSTLVVAKPTGQESHDNGISFLNKILAGLGVLFGVILGVAILLSIIKKSKRKLPDDLGPEFDLENESQPINQKPDSVDSQIVMSDRFKRRTAFQSASRTEESAHAPTIIKEREIIRESNNGSNLLTGVFIGNMLSSHHDHGTSIINENTTIINNYSNDNENSSSLILDSSSNTSSWSDDTSTKSWDTSGDQSWGDGGGVSFDSSTSNDNW